MPDIKDYDYQRPPNMPEGVAVQQCIAAAIRARRST